jgi:prepilin-type N-terminal cleavage/methylation domain-containing protein
MRPSCRGFSLVELSIVLVILGLITGGVLAGQSLIRAAEIRSVTSDLERYQTATRTFLDRYKAFPGDFAAATDVWGAVDPTPATCNATASDGKATCNGNDDGIIACAGGVCNEVFHVWIQLANAGLIEGKFNGITGSGGTFHNVLAVNAPKSRISSAGFSFWGSSIEGVGGADANWFPTHIGNIIMFGMATNNGITAGSALTPAEAWNIDTKFDDAKPGLGKVLTWKKGSATNPDCTTDTDPQVAEYDLARSDKQCSIHAYVTTQ